MNISIFFNICTLYACIGFLRRVLARKTLSSKTAEVMAALKDSHQKLPNWWLSAKAVFKKHCHQRLLQWRLSSKNVSKTVEVMAVLKKTVIKDCSSNGCLERLQRRLLKESSDQRLPKWWLSSTTPKKTAEVMAVLKGCDQRLPKWWLSSKTDPRKDFEK